MADFGFWNSSYKGTSQVESETTFLVIISIILAILAIFINGCLILVIWKSKLLQTCTNMFILSLLVSELLVGGIGTFVAGLFRLHQELGKDIITCEAIGFFQTLGRSASTFSLMLVCIDRVVAVKKPLRYMYLMSPRSTTVLIVYAWIHGLILALFPCFGFASCLLNPIFIALSNKRFKTRCKQVVMCRKNRLHNDSDAFNVSTGLHSAIEATMVAGFLPQKGDRMLIKHISERRSRLENAALLLRLSTVSNPVTLRTIRNSFDQAAGQSVA
ncbi:hypothetical protein LOTGIDRAFT_167335 [Lottia gigantea]|uniref:G-protein coupled receptors family 1 profile domain-containing protein n=1 Tax=Lottia gigantea TaxID=225164 RepID=V3ZPL9_LOTGI|nr:hypothetical protein LOTGIDRAFT_167335 [Lottia gigantea]ESO86292.1 hypothetical protein LOTGIDRAFT_167335 [Lottia gigantea]